MKKNQSRYTDAFFITSLILFFIGLCFGLLAGLEYVLPSNIWSSFGFERLRPMHVTSVLFWILLGATACVYSGLNFIIPDVFSKRIQGIQFFLWLFAILGIFSAYIGSDFGGREYWEFNPSFALPIAIAWILFVFNFFKAAKRIKNWPVYIWMWMTGIVFFMFAFTENYLWIFPYFREHMMTDMTVQWKVNGSLVGSWNQMLYGTAFFIMEKIESNNKVSRSKLAFAMYFLGLFNLMFNWGHHIYTLPTEQYIKYVGYAVSMTEWVFFIRIIYLWKQSVSQAKALFHYFPYRFILAADVWVFINLFLAILMSIPAFNILTHGTHITVAHAMGTTIGINTMILLAAFFEFFSGKCEALNKENRFLNKSFWTTQIALFVFWIALIVAGIMKGIWQMSANQMTYTKMMQSLTPYFTVFLIAGSVLFISLSIPILILLRSYFFCKKSGEKA